MPGQGMHSLRHTMATRLMENGVPQETICGLLGDESLHIVVSALDIIIATAAAGEEEVLITEGIIAKLDRIQDHKDPLVRKKVQEALWLLAPEVEEVVTSKPQDEY